MKKIGLMVVLISSILMTTGCGETAPKPKKNKIVLEGGMATTIETSKAEDYYEAIGMGAPSPNATVKAAKRQTSYEAAKAAALNDIASYVYGVRLDSGTLVSDAMVEKSEIKLTVSHLIRGAEVVKREWLDEDDSCVVTMKINMKEFKQKLKQMGIE